MGATTRQGGSQLGTGCASSAWKRERREKIISCICELAEGRSKSKPVGSIDRGRGTGGVPTGWQDQEPRTETDSDSDFQWLPLSSPKTCFAYAAFFTACHRVLTGYGGRWRCWQGAACRALLALWLSASSQSSGSILLTVARAHVGSQVHCTSAGSGSSSHCLPPMVVATAGSSVATHRSRVHIV